jgi:hypothetical protein
VGERADDVSAARARGNIGSGDDARFGAESDPELIAAEIEATRGEMTETIAAIQDRLDPERLSEHAITTAAEVTDQAVEAATEIADQAREAAKDVVKYAIDEAKTAVNELAAQARTAVREVTVGRVEAMAMQTRDTAESVRGDLWTTIRQNPVPAALAAIGIGWLCTHRGGSPASSRGMASAWGASSSYYGAPSYGAYGVAGERQEPSAAGAQEMASQVAGQVQERAGQVQEAAGQVVSDLQARAGLVQQQVQERARQAPQQAQGFWQTLEANPVAVGALGVVLGGAAALLIPETEQEHQLMGETRDRVIGNVQQVAGETIAKAQRVATEVGRSAMDAADAEGVLPGSGSGTSASSSI